MKEKTLLIAGAVFLGGAFFVKRAKAKALEQKAAYNDALLKDINADDLSAGKADVTIVSNRPRATFASPAFVRAARDAGVGLDWLDVHTDNGSAMFETFVRESDFFLDATNGDHFGIGQLDSAAYKDTIGGPPGLDPYAQALAAFRYIKKRYSTPVQALLFHDDNGWY